MIKYKIGDMVKVLRLNSPEQLKDAFGIIIGHPKNSNLYQIEFLDIVVKRLGCSRRMYCTTNNLEIANR
jgi:hypothetical protein